MIRLLICIATILLLLFPGILSAGNSAPSDRELLEELYSQSLRALIPGPEPGTSRELRPVYAGDIAPSERTRALTDAVLSSIGYSIADSVRGNGRILTIQITDARCTLKKQGKEYDRFLSLTLHARGADRSGAIHFARGCERTAHDRISGKLRKATDTVSQFSPSMQRRVLNGGPDITRISSLLVLSAALGFFAFK